MARFKGFGVTLEVRSDDHGKLGNSRSPAHAHVLNNSGKEVAEIVLSTKQPQSPKDIVWYRTPNPPPGLDKLIVKLANSPNKSMKSIGMAESMWQSVIRVWVYFHGN